MNTRTIDMPTLLEQVIEVSQQAGAAILDVYNSSDFGVQTKGDDSPLTKADLAAHHILAPALAQLLEGVPVLSEESELPPWSERQTWQRYWIIDPLDGTKEFINRNDEFTVNVALIENGVPILGVVYVPVYGWTYAAASSLGAVKIDSDGRRAIGVRTVASRLDTQQPVQLVASRRHGAEAIEALVARAEQALGKVERVSMGSSLKLCLVAEGEADLYPRLALTSEWDTAAAQAVVEAAGGTVVDSNFELLRYNQKDDILNPFFHVIGDSSFNWQSVINAQ